MKAHTTWVVARIKTVTAFASKTFTAVAPKGTTAPYVVVYPADGMDRATRVTGPSASQNPRFTLHVVGTSYDNTATITAAIKAKFRRSDGHGVVPTITGELCGGVWWNSPIPVQVDNDVAPPLVYQIIELGFESSPVAVVAAP